MRRTPLGKDRILVGPYATLLAVDPDSTDWPDLSELAENGLALLVPTSQMPAKMPKARIDMPPHGHPALAERARYLLANKMGVGGPARRAGCGPVVARRERPRRVGRREAGRYRLGRRGLPLRALCGDCHDRIHAKGDHEALVAGCSGCLHASRGHYCRLSDVPMVTALEAEELCSFERVGYEQTF
jgi:hypothetical protein